MDEQPGQAVSIGQDDQSRERAMEAEQFKRDSEEGRGADATATPAEQRQAAGGGQVRPIIEAPDDADDFRPGQAEQPDREDSPGLAGRGPAQPID